MLALLSKGVRLDIAGTTCTLHPINASLTNNFAGHGGSSGVTGWKEAELAEFYNTGRL